MEKTKHCQEFKEYKFCISPVLTTTTDDDDNEEGTFYDFLIIFF